MGYVLRRIERRVSEMKLADMIGLLVEDEFFVVSVKFIQCGFSVTEMLVMDNDCNFCILFNARILVAMYSI